LTNTSTSEREGEGEGKWVVVVEEKKGKMLSFSSRESKSGQRPQSNNFSNFPLNN